jgi:pyruvate dehydrogenase E2 component (dihydrolipoamide acetyltransferase)
MAQAEPVTVIMPQLGLTMREGTIVRWTKRDGEQVAVGEVLCVIETEKITHEIEAASAGTLQTLAPEGASVPTGEAIGQILVAGQGPARALAPAPFTGSTTPLPQAMLLPAPSARAARHKREISPLALRLAQGFGLDLKQIAGSGPQGRIHKADVLQALEHLLPYVEDATLPLVAPGQGGATKDGAEMHSVAPYESETLPPMRRVAEQAQENPRTIAPLTLMMEADVTHLLALLAQVQAAREGAGAARVTFMHALIKATALALREHRRLNAALVGQELRLFREVNIGVTTALESEPLVLVIRQADTKRLGAISRELLAFTEQAQRGGIQADAFVGGAFPLTDLGPLGIDYFTSMLSGNQSGALGVGRIVERQSMRSGEAARQQTVGLSLTFDHRVVDSVSAAAFLGQVRSYLEQPWRLLLAAS